MNTMNQPYEQYKPSGINWLGDIPSHWEAKKLKYCLSIQSGDALVKEDFIDGGQYTVFGGNGEMGYTDKYNSEEVSLIIGRVGAKCGNVRLIAGKKWISDNALLAHTPEDYKFMAYYLEAINLNRLANVSAQPLITGTLVRDQAISLPPLAEQHAIATYLDRKTSQIDDLVARKEQLLALLQQKRQAIINEAVTRGLDANAPKKDSGIEWMGDIPAHWEVKKLKSIAASIQTGPFGSQLHSEDYIEDATPVINPANIQNGHIIADSKNTVNMQAFPDLRRHLLKPGDIIFGRRGEMGRCALVEIEQENWLCGTGCMLVKLTEDWVVPSYISTYLQTQLVKEYLTVHSVGSTMENLNATILGNIPVVTPPLAEQQNIIKYLASRGERVDQAISEIKTQLAHFKNYRQSLISEVVTGKVDVRANATAEA